MRVDRIQATCKGLGNTAPGKGQSHLEKLKVRNGLPSRHSLLLYLSPSVNTGQAGPFWGSAPSFIPPTPCPSLLCSSSPSRFQNPVGNSTFSHPDFLKHSHYFLEKQTKKPPQKTIRIGPVAQSEAEGGLCKKILRAKYV